MNPKTIWNERQNMPTLVVRDLASYAPADIIYEVLLRRGIFKWLAARRDIIKVKNVWKARIKDTYTRTDRPREWIRGYRKAYEEARKEVRAICHSERWRAPDIDRNAQRWLAQRQPLSVDGEKGEKHEIRA